MKLYEKDGKLFFDYEGTRSDLFTFGTYGFKHIGNGLRVFVPTSDAQDDITQLSLLLDVCKYEDITVTDGAKAAYEKMKQEAEELRQRLLKEREAERERQERKARWELIQKYGCKGCSELRRWNDDHVCAYTKKILDERNIAETRGMYAACAGGVYHPFAIAPYPCEGCKHEFKEEL